ncbi:MAG: signal peptidase II [Anaerolineales bacterium]
MTKNFRDYLPDYVFLLSIASTILVLDQRTKWLVRQRLNFSEMWMPLDWLAPYARIVNWRNTGAAFGIFQNAGAIFAILAIVVALAILNYYPLIPRADKFLRIALALQLGGAVGNLTDRLTLGWVTDFVSIGHFPVFNVADASIFFGVTLLLFPYLSYIPGEISTYLIARRARAINTRRRVRGTGENHANDPDDGDEGLSLGILEVIFHSSPQMQRFVLAQRGQHIRKRYAHNHCVSSKMGRQPKPRSVRTPTKMGEPGE